MKINSRIILFLITLILTLPSCVKDSKFTRNPKDEDLKLLPYEKRLLLEEEYLEKLESKHTKNKSAKNKQIKNNKYELDFTVKNQTGKDIYVVCFSYINKTMFGQWRWDKSKVYKLSKNQTAFIDIDTINDKEHRDNVYGALGVFNNLEEAEDSTYELLSEKRKLDLDRLYKLKNKTVEIGVEKYGFKKDLLDFKITPDPKTQRELDFVVENKTGHNLWICCFVYQKKEDMPVWRFDKTNVQLIKNNKSVIIDVDTITNKHNRVYTSGFLGIFDEKQKKEAEKSTYELLKPENKIGLGKLAGLRNKKIVLEIEKYGFENDFIDISIKPTKKIFK